MVSVGEESRCDFAPLAQNSYKVAVAISQTWVIQEQEQEEQEEGWPEKAREIVQAQDFCNLILEVISIASAVLHWVEVNKESSPTQEEGITQGCEKMGAFSKCINSHLPLNSKA